MRATGGFISGIYHLAVLNDRHTGRAAAHVDDHTIVDPQYLVRCRGLLHKVRTQHAGCLNHIGSGADLSAWNTRRKSAGRPGELSTDTFLRAFLQRTQQIHRPPIIDHESIPNHLGKLVLPGERITRFIQHHQYGICRTKIDPHAQVTLRHGIQPWCGSIRIEMDDLLSAGQPTSQVGTRDLPACCHELKPGLFLGF